MLEIIHKKEGGRTGLPNSKPRITGEGPVSVLKGEEKVESHIGETVSHAPATEPLPPFETRAQELEMVARQYEQERKMHEIAFDFKLEDYSMYKVENEVPRVPEEYSMEFGVDYSEDMVFPLDLWGDMGNLMGNLPPYPDEYSPEGEPFDSLVPEGPVKIAGYALLDPQLRMEYNIQDTKRESVFTKDDEFLFKLDSKGNKMKLRSVKAQSIDQASPQLLTPLTLAEIKMRARSLAYAEFKRYRREKNRRILMNWLVKLKAVVYAIIFTKKFVRLFGSKVKIKRELMENQLKEEETGRERAESVSSFKSASRRQSYTPAKEVSNRFDKRRNSVISEEERATILTTPTSLTAPRKVSAFALEHIQESENENEYMSSPPSLEDNSSSSSQSLHLDVTQLKEFMEKLDKCQDLEPKFLKGYQRATKEEKIVLSSPKRATTKEEVNRGKVQKVFVENALNSKLKKRKDLQEELAKKLGVRFDGGDSRKNKYENNTGSEYSEEIIIENIPNSNLPERKTPIELEDILKKIRNKRKSLK